MILFVSATGWLGGPARSLATVLRHLENAEACVLASPAGELHDLVRAEHTVSQFVVLPRHPKWKRLSRLSAGLIASVWLVAHRDVITAIHANGLSELNAIGPGALIARIPIVVWNHSSVTSPIAGRMARVWRVLLPCIRWAAVSDTARSMLLRSAAIPEDSVAIIPNPIDRQDNVKRGQSGQSSTPIRIGYLSEASETKGFDVLLKTARILEDVCIEWRLFTNLAPGTANWQAASAISTVRICGRFLDVSLAYDQCDIVFCPSRRESFGRVAAEAMANGLPVVASDIPAFRQLIGDGEAGVLFAPGDPAGAARAMVELVHESSLRRKMGSIGRQRVAYLEPSLVVPRLTQMYASL